MKIISAEQIDMSKYGHLTSCKVFCIHVQIDDISNSANEIMNGISDTSWISELDAVSKKSFTAMATPTIQKIVNEILSKVTNSVSNDFGEYLVSYTAQMALVSEYNHKKMPLAELIKEKIIGNPGFDFHTESTDSNIIFGEAKYSSEGTPRGRAISQISRFIILEKDAMELNALAPLISSEAKENFLENKKGFTAAFSFNSADPQLIFNNTLTSASLKRLLGHQELYIISVEVC